MSFIQQSAASTPAKDRSKGREKMSKLEEARVRARQEVEKLLSGGREQELEKKLHNLSAEKSKVDDDLKQVKHNESMGKEVIKETTVELKKNQANLEKQANLWEEAKNMLATDKDNEELRKDEDLKRKQKSHIHEKVENMTAIIEEENRKLENQKERIEEIMNHKDSLEAESRRIKQELEKSINARKEVVTEFVESTNQSPVVVGENISPNRSQPQGSTQSQERQVDQVKEVREDTNATENIDILEQADMSVDNNISQEVEVDEQADPDSEHLLNAGVEASPEVELQLLERTPAGGTEVVPEEEDQGVKAVEAPEITKHSQDAPPSAGVSQGQLAEVDRSTQDDSTGAADHLEGPGDMVSKYLQDAPPSVGASEGTGSSINVTDHELTTLSEEVDRSTQEDLTGAADHLEGPGDSVSKDLQDAPPSVGASEGTGSSINVPDHELTTLLEVQPLQQKASAAEAQDADSQEDFTGAADQLVGSGDVVSKHSQDAPLSGSIKRYGKFHISLPS